MRADIKAFLPAAVNYAMDKAYNLNLQVEGDRDYPSEFYSVFTEVPINRDARVPYIDLVLGTVPLKGGAGVRFVYDNCGHQYSPLTDSAMGSIGYYEEITSGMMWYRRTGATLQLYGLKFNPLIEVISYQAITKVEDLSLYDDLPLQAGSEIEVLGLMIQWFEKKFGYTTLVNSRDVNAVDTK